jgi:peptidoglycan/LPS O-acetylase OafA/YrhL
VLDGLRGVAALSVLIIHLGISSGMPGLTPLAFLSVDLFFMLSGFVIGSAYEPKLRSGMTLRRFVAIRAARFLPGLAIGVVLAAATHLWLGRPPADLILQVPLHLLLIPDVTSPVLFPLNGVLWTLFFEIVLNVAHAAFVRKLTTLRLMILTGACGALWAWTAGQTGNWGGGWNWASVMSGTCRVGWAYGIGLLLYRLTKSGRIRVPVLPGFAPISAAVIVLLAPALFAGTARIIISLFVLLPVILVLAAHARLSSGGRRAAAWFGGLSYPLYTMHPPLLLIAAALLGTAPASRPLWALAAVAIVLIAAAAFHFCETPARMWLKGRVGRSRGSAGQVP